MSQDSSSSVPRDSVFTLADGTFVVQRAGDRVQELLSGENRSYHIGDFGQPISDYELYQLKAVGRVLRFDTRVIWLHDLTENDRSGSAKRYYSGPVRIRAYYLNTALPETRLTEVQNTLKALEADGSFSAQARDSLVAVLGQGGAEFHQLGDAERAQKYLILKAPELFQHTAIAFVETTDLAEPETQLTGVSNIMHSGQESDVTADKRVLVLMGNAEERAAIGDSLREMQMEATLADSGVQGLYLLEDVKPDLLIMDVQLPDMHAWELLAKIKEIGTFDALPKIMIADHHAKSDDQVFALTVGKVDVYLVKPISIAQLRQNIWFTLKTALD